VTAVIGSPAMTSTDSAMTTTVLGLTSGTTYTFVVTATNAIGTSDPSAPSNPVTPFVAPTPTPTPVPGVTSWGLGALAVLLGMVVLWKTRRQAII
jgi:hypothetical protein